MTQEQKILAATAASNLENANIARKAMQESFQKAIGCINTYLISKLKELGLDGEVRRGKERKTGTLLVENGSICYVQKVRQRNSSKLVSSQKCTSETRAYYYNGAYWLQYKDQPSPDEAIEKLVNVYHFRKADEE